MILRGAQPLRDFADAELRGAWPALSYAMPAWAQQIGGRSLLSEAYLTIGALALSTMVIFALALDLSKRWSVAALAAAIVIAMGPKLYNYPKVLSLALGALALRIVASRPTFLPLLFGAFATAVATLFRHDYGVYVAVGLIATIIARIADGWRITIRRLALYAGLTTALLMPSAIWVQRYEGIPQYVRAALTSARLETQRTQLSLDPFSWAHPLSGDALLVVTYCAFWCVLATAAVILAVRIRSTEPERRAVAIGLLAMAAVVNVFFLRANLGQRFGDAVGPIVLLGALAVGEGAGLSLRAARVLAVAVPVALLVTVFAATWVFRDVSTNLRLSGLSDPWLRVKEHFQEVRGDLSRLPPARWNAGDAPGTLVAARYVAECTGPDDYLMVAGYAPEIPVFARRRFAGGQGTVALSFYTSRDDQRRTLARLEKESVPVILADARDYEDGFVSDYPLLAEHVAREYRRVGVIPVDDTPGFLVFAKADMAPRRMDPWFGLPCFQ